jgi:4-azaleucine resistance transporter AzlC
LTTPEPVYRRPALVLAAAVGLVAVTFGVLAATAGLSLAKAMAMSALVFTGASQFAAVGVIGSGGSPISAVGGALLLAARNGLYGVRLSSLITGSLPKRALAAHLVIDETTGMATAQFDEEDARGAFWLTGVALFCFWLAGTAVGVYAGELIGDPGVYGLDAAFPASFVALLAPQLRDRPAQVSALFGAVIAVVCVPLTPVGVPILASAAAVVPGLFVARRSGSHT